MKFLDSTLFSATKIAHTDVVCLDPFPLVLDEAVLISVFIVIVPRAINFFKYFAEEGNANKYCSQVLDMIHTMVKSIPEATLMNQ